MPHSSVAPPAATPAARRLDSSNGLLAATRPWGDVAEGLVAAVDAKLDESFNSRPPGRPSPRRGDSACPEADTAVADLIALWGHL
jgi:hypothetical protein